MCSYSECERYARYRYTYRPPEPPLDAPLDAPNHSPWTKKKETRKTHTGRYAATFKDTKIQARQQIQILSVCAGESVSVRCVCVREATKHLKRAKRASKFFLIFQQQQEKVFLLFLCFFSSSAKDYRQQHIYFYLLRVWVVNPGGKWGKSE